MVTIEPKEAFPYTPPSDEILDKYAYIFKIKNELPIRYFKNFFDKFVSIIFNSNSTNFNNFKNCIFN